jgi:isocitrate dehydrogenase (NAD+)
VVAGDQSGQELLLESLRVLAPELTRVPTEFAHFDLSLEQRRASHNAVVREAATAMAATGLGLKAATITPEARATWARRTPSCAKPSTAR